MTSWRISGKPMEEVQIIIECGSNESLSLHFPLFASKQQPFLLSCSIIQQPATTALELEKLSASTEKLCTTIILLRATRFKHGLV